jgi:hypothetical protein
VSRVIVNVIGALVIEPAELGITHV